MKLIRKNSKPQGYRARWARIRDQLNEDARMRLFSVEAADYKCPKCGDEVSVVSHAHKPDIRGAYCKCAQWVGHVSRIPLTPSEWLDVVNLNVPHYPIDEDWQ